MIRDYSKKLSVYDYASLGDNKCWYCGDVLFPSTKTKDHFWPKSLGGRLKVCCCKNCNALKRNLTPNEFIKLMEKLKNKHPHYAPWQKRFDRIINATETLWEKVKWSV